MHLERLWDLVRLRLRSLLRRNSVERELERELRCHLDQEAEENIRLGIGASEACSAATRRLGGIAQIQEECRDVRRTSHIENLARDLRYTWRTLAKAPAFTLAAIVTLALGIGANSAIFQLLDAVRLRTVPVPEPHRLAQIRIPNMNFGILSGRDNLSYPLYREIRANQQAFSEVFAWDDGYDNFRVGEGAEARHALALGVTGEFFLTLGIAPAAGRLFRSEDDFRGCPAPGVVLSYDFWQKAFGGSASAIGRSVFVQGHALQVIGVTPAGFTGLEVGSHFDLALPLCYLYREANTLERPDNSFLIVMGRLKPGWTLARASEHLRAISAGLMRATLPSGYPNDYLGNYLQLRLEAISGATGICHLREQYDHCLWLLLGLSALVLLIACANLSNLMLARAGARSREFAVRLALGAGRGRLIRQMLTEGLVLAATGALLGLAVAAVLSRAIVHFLVTPDNPMTLDLVLDWRMFGFTAGVACLTCILLSVAPAIRAARGQAADAMKAGARGLTMDRSRFGVQRVLVVVQVSISLVLVTGAFLFVASFRRLVTMDPGFHVEGLLQVGFDLGKHGHDENVLRQLIAEVRATPQVESAATTTRFPFGNGTWSLIARTDAATRDVRFTWVSPGYFATIGTRILAGREIGANDGRTSPKTALVNENFARLFFPGSDPVGKTFRTQQEPDYPEAEYQIVGLVGNTRYGTLQAADPAMAFAPASQFPPGYAGDMMFVRSRAPLGTVEASLRRRIEGWRPGTGMEFETLQQNIADTLTRERLLAALSGFFGVLAGLLASIGLYGVLAYQTVRRHSEIGIRLALGAERGQIMQLVLEEAARLVVAGLAIGLVGSLALGRAVASLLFSVSPRDPFHLVAAAVALAIAAAIGSIIPALHAARLDPMDVLREE